MAVEDMLKLADQDPTLLSGLLGHVSGQDLAAYISRRYPGLSWDYGDMVNARVVLRTRATGRPVSSVAVPGYTLTGGMPVSQGAPPAVAGGGLGGIGGLGLAALAFMLMRRGR